MLNQPAAQRLRRCWSRAATSAAARRASTRPGRCSTSAFRAVVSTEIADIFRSNCLKNGLLPVVVDEADARVAAREPGRRSRRSTSPPRTLRLPDGRDVQFPLEAFARYCLMNGVDELGFLLQPDRRRSSAYERSATAHEGTHRRARRATASAPRSRPRRCACCRRSATKFGHDFEFAEALIGGAAIDATGSALPPAHDRRVPQQRDAVLLGAVGGPKWSDPTPRVRPEQGLLELRRDARRVRQPAPGAHASGAARRLAAQARGRRRRGHHGRARTHRRHLLRRARAARRTTPRTSAATPPTKSSASRAWRAAWPWRAPQAHRLGRQGQRARDLAPVARSGRTRDRATNSRTSSSSTCWSTRRPCT